MAMLGGGMFGENEEEGLSGASLAPPDSGASVASGAATGAAAGMIAGPIGAAVGGVVGAGVGAFDAQGKKKKAKKAREKMFGKHTRLAKIKETLDAEHEKKMASMAGLSQAAMQWADMSR